ncbi:MAG: hypothetical protein KME22_13985 [Hassallia sp. WJT32-NPBG1]|nr:hypothetical protein [Hassallia sp. WJT32-NPBG1]
MTALLLALIEQGWLKFVYGTNPRNKYPALRVHQFDGTETDPPTDSPSNLDPRYQRSRSVSP